jgi:hypothetical protein
MYKQRSTPRMGSLTVVDLRHLPLFPFFSVLIVFLASLVGFLFLEVVFESRRG